MLLRRPDCCEDQELKVLIVKLEVERVSWLFVESLYAQLSKLGCLTIFSVI